jgi:hypothetical protein
MAYVMVTVQMNEKELAQIDDAAKIDAERRHKLRPNRSDVVRIGALRYARELLASQKDGEDR